MNQAELWSLYGGKTENTGEKCKLLMVYSFTFVWGTVLILCLCPNPPLPFPLGLNVFPSVVKHSNEI